VPTVLSVRVDTGASCTFFLAQLFTVDGQTVLRSDSSCNTMRVAITTPGRYIVQVSGNTSRGLTPYVLRASRQNSVCGNGVREAGEVCDDGNIADGDGCSHECRADETFAESEPNDDGSIAVRSNDFAVFDADGPISHTLLVRGTIVIPGDEDVYLLANPGDDPVRATVSGFGQPADFICTVALRLALRDEFGQVLASQPGCAVISATIPAHGKIYLHVAESTDSVALGTYHAFVQLLKP
jgi:cysteine-rich repeat protein